MRPSRRVNRRCPLGTLLLVLVVAFSTAPRLSAQSYTQSATIKVGVSAGLSLYVDRNLSFGDVVSGTGANSVGLTSPNVGHVTIGGSKNTVTVTLTPPSALTDGNSHSITYTPEAAYNPSADDPSTAIVMAPSGQTSFALGNHVSGNNYQGYLYLYGSIDVQNVPAGSYSGQYTVSVTY